MKMGVASERPQDLNVVPLSWKQGFPWLFVYRNCTAGSLDGEVYHTLALLEKRWSNMESLYFELLPKTKSSDFFIFYQLIMRQNLSPILTPPGRSLT